MKASTSSLHSQLASQAAQPARREPWYLSVACRFPLLDLITLAFMLYLVFDCVKTELVGQVDAWLLTGDRAKVDRFMNRCGAAVMTIFVLYVSFAMFTAWYSGVFDRLVR